MAQNYAKGSEFFVPFGIRLDVASLSPIARRRQTPLAAPVATQATATESIFPLAAACKVVSAYLVYPGTVPAVSGGTATIKIEHIASDGSTAVSIVDAVTILSGFTTQIPVALTLASTNPTTMAAGGSILVTVTTSNNTVGAPGTGGMLTLYLEPTEDSSISE